MVERIRSYFDDVTVPIERLRCHSNVTLQELGKVQNGADSSPLYKLIIEKNNGMPKHNILISAGVHGDEPAGVWAVLNFLEATAFKYLRHFRFFVYPCVNAGGYELNTRFDLNSLNLNRECHNKTKSYINRLIIDSLRRGPNRYSVTLDLHESDDIEIEEFTKLGFAKEDYPDGFYIYELAEDHRIRIGKKIINVARQEDIPICTKPVMGDSNSDGVIYYPECYKSEAYVAMTTFEGYLIQNYTNHAFTVETMLDWQREMRIRAHLLAITTVLEEYKMRG